MVKTSIQALSTVKWKGAWISRTHSLALENIEIHKTHLSLRPVRQVCCRELNNWTLKSFISTGMRIKHKNWFLQRCLSLIIWKRMIKRIAPNKIKDHLWTCYRRNLWIIKNLTPIFKLLLSMIKIRWLNQVWLSCRTYSKRNRALMKTAALWINLNSREN